MRTGVDSLPGKIGTVVSSSRGAMQEGAVKVFGSTWTAYPAEGESPLEAGERVMVESIEGSSIYVRRIDEGWTGARKNFRNEVASALRSKKWKMALAETSPPDF